MLPPEYLTMRSHNQINQVCQEIDAFRGFDQKKSINIHVGYLFNNARPRL